MRAILKYNALEKEYGHDGMIYYQKSQCSVNGLSLNMVFDTGASDVTISSVEANFMLKNNYLSKDDIKGRNYYQIAHYNPAWLEHF